MSTKADLAKLAIGLIISVTPSIQIKSTVHNFSTIYKDWGIPPSAFTQFLLTLYPFFYLLPILVIAAWFIPKWHNRRGTVALNIGISIFLLGLLFGIALWWPVMNAKVVST